MAGGIWVLFAGLAGQNRTLSTNVSGTATASQALAANRSFSDTVIGSSVVSETVRVARSFLDAVAAGSSVTDALVVARHLADTIGASSAIVDNLVVLRSLRDTVGGASSVVDQFVVARSMAESVQGSTLFTDALIVARSLKETVSASGNMVDAMAAFRTFRESIVGSSTTSWDITFVIAFLMSISGTSSTSAVPMGVTRGFLDSVAGRAQVSESVRVARALADSLTSFASMTEQVIATRPLADTVHGVSSVLDSLGVTRRISDTISGTATVSNETLSIRRGLLDSIASISSMQETFSTLRPMASNISGTSVISSLELMIISYFFLTASGLATLSEEVSILRTISATIFGGVSISNPLSVRRVFGLIGVARTLLLMDFATNLLIISNENILTVVSPVFDLRTDRVVDTTVYELTPLDGGVQTQVLSAVPSHSVVATGTNGTILGATQTSNTVSIGSTPLIVGQYLVIVGRWQNTKARVVSSPSLGVAVLDATLITDDPDNGSLSWTLLTPVRGMTLTLQEPTNGKTYKLFLSGLLTVDGLPFSASSRWQASVTGPTVVSAQFMSATGGVLVSFNSDMLIDDALLNPVSYIINPVTVVRASVQILGVQTVGPSQVLLRTHNFEQGTYTLTVLTGFSGPVTVVIDGPKNTARNFISSS